MRIKVNERYRDVADGISLFAVRDEVMPRGDVLVLNGGPVRADVPLSDSDEVVLIRRGEAPSREALETLMAARHTPGVHAAVKKSCVGVAGLGGLGSAVAIALARVGVGRLVLADFDVVEPSNLNRQQYFVDQIGMLKTEAMATNLARINPYVTVETSPVRLTADNTADVFRDADVLVEAFDVPESKVMLLESFSRTYPDRSIVMASGLAGYDQSNTIQTRRIGANVFIVGDLVRAAAPGTGLMAPRVGVAAHHQANAVLRILLGHDPTAE